MIIPMSTNIMGIPCGFQLQVFPWIWG